MAFAKLFETEEHGQILVKIDSVDGCPEVRFYFKPENLGVCSVALEFQDSDRDWDLAEKIFAETTAKSAALTVLSTKENIVIKELIHG